MSDTASSAGSSRDFELPNPQLTATQAREVLAAYWGLDGRVDEVGSTQDQNFRVECADGRRFALKVASPLWSHEELDLQDAAMRHLAASGPGFAVPEPVAALDGSGIVAAFGHLVRVLTWVDGLPLWQVGRLRSESWRALGQIAARSAQGLRDLEHPALDRVLQWDSRRAEEVVGVLAADEPAETRARLEDIMARVRRGLHPAPDLPVQPIHCDVTDLNTVTDEGHSALPTGLLDFGDVVRTWRVCDPVHAAVALVVHDLDDPLGVVLEVLAGYRSASPLTPAELDMFWLLMLARAAVCAIHSTRQARLSPASVFVSGALERDWAILDAIAGTPDAVATAAIRAAGVAVPRPRATC